MFVFILRHLGRAIVQIDQTDTHKKKRGRNFFYRISRFWNTLWQ